MKLTFLGTSHGKPEKHRFCTSTVVTVRGKHYIIDAGAPIVDLLQRYDMAFEDIAGIFITHSHIDHIAGLPLFNATLNSPKRFHGIAFDVLVPDMECYHAMFDFLRGSREIVGRISYKKYEQGIIFDDGTVKITAIPTQHYQNSHAFLVEAEGKSVVFTGDLKPDMCDYPALITATGEPLDLVVMEAAHQPYQEPFVRERLNESNTRQMIIHHIAESRNTLEVIEHATKALHFPTHIAFDGMVVEL